MFRKGLFVVVLVSFFSGSSIAVSDNKAELSLKFSAAQRLARQGQVTQAIAAYQSLIRLHPQLPEAYNNLAALYLKQNNTRQAKAILEQGLHAHKGYGVLYESLTAINVAMAREAYSKALQIDLKPFDITIASLSLSDAKEKHKTNTIVISKTNNTDVKPAKQNRQAKKTQTIENVLKAWSAAWSAQAVDMYLSFYHKQYKPSNGLSRKGWVQSRRYRLKKPDWIKIGLSNFKVEKNSAKQTVVRFNQLYQSNSFRDESAKQIVLLYTEDGWKIFRETSL